MFIEPFLTRGQQILLDFNTNLNAYKNNKLKTFERLD